MKLKIKILIFVVTPEVLKYTYKLFVLKKKPTSMRVSRKFFPKKFLILCNYKYSASIYNKSKPFTFFIFPNVARSKPQNPLLQVLHQLPEETLRAVSIFSSSCRNQLESKFEKSPPELKYKIFVHFHNIS